MPLVSVIMGVYNCKNKDLLNASIESIINQTYTDWEFLICNDGSSDNTLNWLKEAALKEKRIKIISYAENKGLAYALNKCIENASGKYIARQDDDDYSHKDRLRKEVNFLENNEEYAIVGTIANVFDSRGVYGSFNLPQKPQEKDFLWSSPFLHPSTMMRISALRDVNGYRVSKETWLAEDYDLFMRMYAKGYKGYNIQEKLFNYSVPRNTKKKKRPMHIRIDEVKVRYCGFKKMGILKRGVPYVIKPIFIGLIPNYIINKMNEKKFNK